MTEQPRPLATLRRAVPPDIAAAVHRGLEKLPADRWRTAREFADALRGARAMSGSAATEPPVARPVRAATRWAGIAIATLAGVAIGAALMMARRPATPARATLRFNFETTDSERFVSATPAIPFSISSDDRKVVYAGAAPAGRRLYVRGLDDMQTRALPGTDGAPLQPTFSPDGKWVVFRYRLPTGTNIRWMPADGGAAPVVLVDSMTDPYSARPSHDGKWIVFGAVQDNAGFAGGIAYAPIAGGRKPRLVAAAQGTEYLPSLSPDDKWLLYVNTHTGRAEAYQRPFPEMGPPVQISSAGGTDALWGRDGRTVFYRWGRDVMAARVAFKPAPSVSPATKVFTGDFLGDPGYGQWDIAPDGRHFLMLQNVDSREETILIYNWADELRRSWK